MSDWVRTDLGHVATLQRGFDLPSRLRRPGTVPIVSSSGTSGWHNRVMVKAPGVVTGRYGTIGQVFYQDADFWPLNTTLWVADFHGNDARFISYMLQRVNFSTHSGKSGVPGVNRNDLHAEIVALPSSVAEQRAIAQALQHAENLIASLERAMGKKQAIKQGMMQQLLTGCTRLPGFTLGWRSLRLSSESLFKARIGWQGLTTGEYRTSGSHRLVGGIEFEEGSVDWGRTPFVEKWRYDQDPYIQLRCGDILLTKDGSIGKTAFVDSLPGPATLNSGVFVLRPLRNAYDPRFMFYMLRSRVFEQFLARLSAGSTISHLYQRDLATLVLDVPPTLDEQEAISEVLADVDKEIKSLRQRLAKARLIKRGMMQQLLTGRTRLPVLEGASA